MSLGCFWTSFPFLSDSTSFHRPSGILSDSLNCQSLRLVSIHLWYRLGLSISSFCIQSFVILKRLLQRNSFLNPLGLLDGIGLSSVCKYTHIPFRFGGILRPFRPMVVRFLCLGSSDEEVEESDSGWWSYGFNAMHDNAVYHRLCRTRWSCMGHSGWHHGICWRLNLVYIRIARESSVHPSYAAMMYCGNPEVANSVTPPIL
jgi:hypothetical protein